MPHWDLDELSVVPACRRVAEDGAVESILYAGEPLRGSATEVFAYMGVPDAKEPVPGMVLVHGGGGTAYRQWVELWNARGYAAIAMDLSGKRPDGARVPNGGPEQRDADIFTVDLGWPNMWTYHAVAAVIRAHTILRGQMGVDAERIGVTGISWGGYLTCIVAGVDDRFACAVPVYGCGHLQHNSAEGWMQAFDRMTLDDRRRWHKLCDPSSYLGDARLPMLFVSGTNDFAYPLDSLKMSYRMPQGPVSLCIRKEMPHGHEDGWAPSEIHGFTDHLFRGAPALPEIGAMSRNTATVRAPVTSARPIRAAWLLHTTDGGSWMGRAWQLAPARAAETEISARLPDGTTTYFLAVEDESGAYASSRHQEITDDEAAL